MARFYDRVGYVLPDAHVNGVLTDNIVERSLYGDILEERSSLEPSDKVNDDVRLQHRISVLADAYALENYSHIKYVYLMGTRWTVQSVTLNRPRLILALGGVYNGRFLDP